MCHWRMGVSNCPCTSIAPGVYKFGGKLGLAVMYFIYCDLNRVINPFEYHIGRYDSTIDDVGHGTQYAYFISVDSAQ